MGNKVNLIKEVYNRIYTATQSGGTLTDIQRVYVGTTEDSRALGLYPVINIQWIGGREIPSYQNKTAVDEIEIEISLICNKLVSETNKIYLESDSSGAVFLFEKLLNVLDKKTTGTVDLNFNSTANSLRGFQYTVDYSSDLIVVTTKVTVQTKSFQIGAR